MRIKFLLIISIFLAFVSCDNVSTEGKSGHTVKTNSSPKLKALSYKMKSGKFFQSDVDSTDLGFDFDISKALSIYINSANYIDLYDPDKVYSYKLAFMDFMYESDEGFVEFKNVKLGNLELKDQNSFWIDPEDSVEYVDTLWCGTLTEGSSTHPDSTDVDSNSYHSEFYLYSWYQEDVDDFPSELSGGATPHFSAEYGDATIGKTLAPLPSYDNVFKHITTNTVVDLNTDFVIDFNSELPAGTFIGFQVMPIFNDVNDSTMFVQGGEIYNLYLETQLTVSASSVKFTADMLKDIKENISDASKVIADVFVFSYEKHDEILIDNAGKKANVILGSSSVVSVHLKK